MSPITAEEASKFANILKRSFGAEVAFNGHLSHFETIREWLTGPPGRYEEADVAACEASGEVWTCDWWSSSCGHHAFISPSWVSLVREVVAAGPTLRRADEDPSVVHED